MTRSTGPPPYTAEPPPSQHHNLQFPEALKSSPTRNSHGTIDTAVTGESIYRIAPTPSPKTTARNRSLVPVRRSQRAELVSGHRQRNNNRQPSSRSQYSYDGAHDYMNESRMTSSTWSTVSKVNNSIITDFSSGSRELTSAKYCSHYNEIATKLGLPKLSPLFTDGNRETLPARKPEQKSTRHGWLSRKLLPRHSTTFTYEARTTYRPVTRKKSFSRPLSSSDSQRNIFENKSLEETCRLGGQGVLPLPEDYAAIKLTLPTCLSATATYLLHHGVNAPGLFRISGQNSVVNELYGYYAFQFGSAGSPTKVQATVQPGVLPIHIPYNLADVSTLFKKIVKEFPGGLLGSLETFDAIRNILLILDPDPVLNHEEVTALRAKLIALTILSISSPARYNLVQALLGLFAYFGDEAEAARWNGQVDPTQSADKAPSTELMGYQALGVCLGPLLLGDLIENLEGSQDETEHGTAVDGEESIKVRKKRHSLIQDKLSTPAHFASIVDCANLTANIMQLLLMIWRDVVKQLSALIARDRLAKGTLVQSQTPQRPKTGRRSTRHSVKVTGEELLFLDMMRGGSMTVSEQPYNVVVKKEFTAKGRSSMPRIVPQSSGNLSLQREWFHDWTRDAPSDDQKGDIESGDGESTVAVSQHKMMDRPSSVSKGETRKPSGTVAIGNDTVVQSQEVPAQVASREDEHTDEETMSYAVSPSASRGSPIKSARFHRSSRSTPDAGSLSNLEPEVVMNITSHRRTRTNDNPLSITKRGLPPPPIEPAPHQDQKFPPRHSSLEKRQPSALRSNIEMVPKDSSSDFALRSAKLNDSLGPEGFDTSLKPTIRSFSSSAPVTGHGAITKDSAPKFALPVIPPFSKPASASSAPAKFPDCTSDGIAIKTGRSSFIMAPTRPLSAYTLDSLRQLELDFQQSDLACQIDRPLSREVSRCSETPFAHAEGVRYRSDSLSSSQARKVTNSTLFAEITRLKRQLEQKEDIVAATRRSLEAARMGREEGPSEYSDEPRLGSWSKGTLSAEIRDLKNQRDAWKHRAEWAEKRLKGVEEMGAVENSWTSKDNAEVASKYRNAHSDLDEVFFA